MTKLDVADEICLLLETVKRLFPEAEVTYSPILPKSTRDEQKDRRAPISDSTAKTIDKIDDINNLVTKVHPRRLLCPAFRNPWNSKYKHKLASDGTHLNQYEIEDFRQMICSHAADRFSINSKDFDCADPEIADQM